MKKTITSLIMLVLGTSMLMANITIGTTSYTADTISHRQIGPGIVNSIIRIPNYPLNIYLLETDLKNSYNHVETVVGYNTVGKTEALTHMASRVRTSTKRPLAACNANFWCVSGNGSPMKDFMLGSPYGTVIRNDSIYVNCAQNVDSWDVGPANTGACGIDVNNTLHLGHFYCQGTIASSKWSIAKNFSTVNRRSFTSGDVAMWTVNYGRTREFEDNWSDYSTKASTLTNSDNYYLKLKNSSRWSIGNDMVFTIEKIVKAADRQTLGDYDACFTVSGVYKNPFSQLVVGDELTVNYPLVATDDKTNKPFISNMVEGNALVMQNGELTGRNTDESYNSMTYSRTGYGSSADGKKLYMIVIDMSTNPIYGKSSGCSTTVMCQILKSLYPDISNVVTFDAGGSAEMMVNDSVINKTTESTPRAVSCAWMLESTAPTDNNIAAIQFEDYRVQIPVYSSYTPKILGYNKYGDLVNEDVKGFTLSCDASLGTANGSEFTAGANVTSGVLTATYNGVSTTIKVSTLAAQPAIANKPMILIDQHTFPLDVSATVSGVTYNYNPAKLNWSIDDNTVATITNGKIKGVKNGKTKFACQIGSFNDNDSVNVEISDTNYKYQEWKDFTFSGSGCSNIALATDGTLSFTYALVRAPYIHMYRDITLYGRPDTIGLTFNSSLPLQYVQIDVRNANHTTSNYVKYLSSGASANTDYTVKIDLDALGGISSLATYPVEIRDIKFTPVVSGQSAGNYAIKLKSLYAHYDTSSGVNEIGADTKDGLKVYPNPVTKGVFTVETAQKANISVYSYNGSLMLNKKATAGKTQIDATGLTPGIYIVKATTDNGVKAAKIIVK
jgi:hypothetical protein